MAGGAQSGQLLLVLGDQLNQSSPLLENGPRSGDVVWMAEVGEESTHVISHKCRTAYVLSAMRHFRDRLRESGWTVDYTSLSDDRFISLSDALADAIGRLKPTGLVVVQPGEWRILEALQACADAFELPLTVLEDTHFMCSTAAFQAFVANRKQPRLEHFYRWMRKDHGILMDGTKPVGGAWNFDTKNRGSFGKDGPRHLPAPPAFPPDALTRSVIDEVEARFTTHPGDLDTFAWPVTPEAAREALDAFITKRLPQFGAYQDAMWTGEPFLYHALISAALNLKLLDPRDVIAAAVTAYHDAPDVYPIAAIEGFVRQILGWREYVRGLYWQHMPDYAEMNALEANRPLPEFYWTAETDMVCMRECVGQVLRLGYGHHIQRLMVTGLYALLLGVRPKEVHAWYLGMYVDAVEWVELPNTVGMSQYADGGIIGSKPYVATGKYIDRMSNYCGDCRYDPAKRTGDDACPFTVLYWDFLLRHEASFSQHPRMRLQVRNVERIGAAERDAIRKRAAELRGSA